MILKWFVYLHREETSFKPLFANALHTKSGTIFCWTMNSQFFSDFSSNFGINFGKNWNHRHILTPGIKKLLYWKHFLSNRSSDLSGYLNNMKAVAPHPSDWSNRPLNYYWLLCTWSKKLEKSKFKSLPQQSCNKVWFSSPIGGLLHTIRVVSCLRARCSLFQHFAPHHSCYN